jgi:hypothetical protein
MHATAVLFLLVVLLRLKLSNSGLISGREPAVRRQSHRHGLREKLTSSGSGVFT